jgi:hypothetical protein
VEGKLERLNWILFEILYNDKQFSSSKRVDFKSKFFSRISRGSDLKKEIKLSIIKEKESAFSGSFVIQGDHIIFNWFEIFRLSCRKLKFCFRSFKRFMIFSGEY